MPHHALRVQKTQEVQKLLKRKLGLTNSAAGKADGSSVCPASLYKDRAAERRKRQQLDHSQHPLHSLQHSVKYQPHSIGASMQCNNVSTSISMPLDDSNVGKVMLQKLGWRDGEGLGKVDVADASAMTNRTGGKEVSDRLLEPIQVHQQLHPRAGLGTPSLPTELIVSDGDNRRTTSWKKTMQRLLDSSRA